jgi:hypothetical protein
MDLGVFKYDMAYPPICIKPPDNQILDYSQSMNGLITSYLQSTYRDGLKHDLTMMPFGITAGEAAVIYFRDLHHKRRRVEKTPVNNAYLRERVSKSLNKYMGINVLHNDIQPIFDRHLPVSLFGTRNYMKKLIPALKSFLLEINMKSKGYGIKLKALMKDLHSFIEPTEDGIVD